MSTSPLLWHYSDGLSSFGPFEASVVRQLLTAGVIKAEFKLRLDGQESWHSAAGLDPDVPPAPVAIPPAPPPPSPQSGTTFFLNVDCRTLGPLPVHEIWDKLLRQEIGADVLAWTDGMTDWLPVSQIPELRLAGNSLPPPPPARREAACVTGMREQVPINPYPFFVSCGLLALASFISLINDLGKNPLAPDAGGLPELLMFLSLVACAVTWAILHFRLWTILPADLRATTPGKAVGLMFVPFFNLYWGFITWPKLWDGLGRWQDQYSEKRETEKNDASVTLPILLCILTGITLLGISTKLEILAYFGFIYLSFTFYRKAVSIAERLRQRI